MALEDHRVRVGAERRERMRARLTEAALLVFGERGVDGSVIDEIIRVAGVARGTYYNYYRSNEELLEAVATDAGNEVMDVVDPVVRVRQDPAARIAAGVRLWLRLARRYPHLAAFFRRAGSYMFSNTEVRDYLRRDLSAGLEVGRFRVADLNLAFDLVAGPVLAAINTMLVEDVPVAYGDHLARSVLMALGVSAAEAEALATEPLDDPVLPPASLIERSGALQLRGGKVT